MKLRQLRLLLFIGPAIAAAQSPAAAPIQNQQQVWQMLDSGTTASLRGIDSVDGTVAWASGTEGTVLRTTDGGAHWQKCAVPDADKDGATLDFRGVQAWDATTAIVMGSGPGEMSRLYRTTDACHTWKLAFANPDKNGFWDAMQFQLNSGTPPDKGYSASGVLVGDPVGGRFPIFTTNDYGNSWQSLQQGRLYPLLSAPQARSGEALFAASNTAVAAASDEHTFAFVTGGKGGARLLFPVGYKYGYDVHGSWYSFSNIQLPILSNETSGAFSIGYRRTPSDWNRVDLMIVGGNYENPQVGSAAFVRHSSYSRVESSRSRVGVSERPPHGYRSTVQWSEPLKLWITAGTNGSDISRDDGKTWQPLDNGNWNALSLPFIVGPKGRIAHLNPAALPPAR